MKKKKNKKNKSGIRMALNISGEPVLIGFKDWLILAHPESFSKKGCFEPQQNELKLKN